VLQIIVLLLLLPVAVLADVLALHRRWHGMPLQQRSMAHATAGAAGLAGCGVLAVHGFPVVGPMLTAGLATASLVYLVAGIHGARGSRFDVLSVWWWLVLVLFAGAMLAFRFMEFPR
jgi:hypothetical protein